jgi:hypothetical protein
MAGFRRTPWNGDRPGVNDAKLDTKILLSAPALARTSRSICLWDCVYRDTSTKR